ncbi:MAG: hypothetical protein GY765_25510, partial [bacterium]|nr:hypothetical protein [bacterium]
PASKKKNGPKIKLSLKNGNYRLVYDNQYRPWVAKQGPRKKNPDKPINIKAVSFVRGILAVDIGDIKMGKTDKRKMGKILLNIQVLDDSSQQVTNVNKAFNCKKKNFVMRIKPPGLKPGKYDIVVNVADLLGESSDIMIKEIKI